MWQVSISKTKVTGAVVLVNCTPTKTDVAEPVLLTDRIVCTTAGKCSLQFIRVLPIRCGKWELSLYVCLLTVNFQNKYQINIFSIFKAKVKGDELQCVLTDSGSSRRYAMPVGTHLIKSCSSLSLIWTNLAETYWSNKFKRVTAKE